MKQFRTLDVDLIEAIKIDAAALIERGIFLAVVLVGGFVLYRIGRSLIRRSVPKNLPAGAQARAQTARALLESVWKYLVLLGIGFTLLTLLPRAVVPAAAVATALGLTISFGAQSFIKDLIAGFSILMEGQFVVGDRVRVYGVEVEGTVESIGLRLTIVRDDDGSRVFVPNGAITAIRNLSTATTAESRAGRGRGRGRERAEERPAETRERAPRDRSRERGGRQRTGSARERDAALTVTEKADVAQAATESAPAATGAISEAAQARAAQAGGMAAPVFELAGTPRAADEAEAEEDETTAAARPRRTRGRRGGRGRRRPGTGTAASGAPQPEADEPSGEPARAAPARSPRAPRDASRRAPRQPREAGTSREAEGPPRETMPEPREVLEESPWSIE